MIRYQLRCDEDHTFEGWFRSSGDFEAQAADGLLVCPVCGSNAVARAVMAPAIVTSRAKADPRAERLAEIKAHFAEAAARARAYVEKTFDNVGDRFPEEARRIHYGETADRPIYGEATLAEAKELIDEGIAIAPLPGAGAEDAAAAGDRKKLN